MSSDQTPIVTFYSYKGGVGRSMALANLTLLLAREYSLNVIAVDWDLEAPGLHRFFDIHDSSIEDGVINYFCRYKERLFDTRGKFSLEDFSILPTLIEIPNTNGKARLMPAGALKDPGGYARCVNEFDWNDFYKAWNGAQLIEFIRQQLKENADMVLIDSRTGVTDIGGICTMQLPDIVVLVFSFNDQNISGTETIARELARFNPVFQGLGRQPEILFLPSRKDLSEIERLRKWERQAALRLDPYVLSPRIKIRYPETLAYFREISIPYVPHFAYGEELAIESEKGIELVKPLRDLAQMLIVRPEASRIKELRSAAANAQSRGEYIEAIDLSSQALKISQTIDDWNSMRDINLTLGNLYSSLGQVERSLEYYQQAMDVAIKSGDRRGQSTVLLNLANASRLLGEFEKAIGYYEEALEIDRDFGNRSGEANLLGSLGLAYRDAGQLEKAVRCYTQALEIAREIGDRPGEGNFLSSLGAAHRDSGMLKEALDCYQQALQIQREMGNQRLEGNLLDELGWVYSDLGQHEVAVTVYQQSLSIARQVGNRALEGNVVRDLGSAHFALGDYQQTIEYGDQAVKILREQGGNLREEADISGKMGSAYANLGNDQGAIETFNRALEIYRELGERQEQANVLSKLVSLYKDLGETDKALATHEQAVEIERELGGQPIEGTELVSSFDKWEKLEGIGSVYAQKLRAEGISNPALLLQKGANPRGRETIASETGISPTLILQWVNRVDLFRIKGVGEEYADLLEAAGVDTTHELARRDAEYLYRGLLRANEEKKLVRRLPTQAQVNSWIEQAKALPRVITY